MAAAGPQQAGCRPLPCSHFFQGKGPLRGPVCKGHPQRPAHRWLGLTMVAEPNLSTGETGAWRMAGPLQEWLGFHGALLDHLGMTHGVS